VSEKKFDVSKCIGDCPKCENSGICPYEKANECQACKIMYMYHENSDSPFTVTRGEYDASEDHEMKEFSHEITKEQYDEYRRLEQLEDDRREIRKLYGRE